MGSQNVRQVESLLMDNGPRVKGMTPGARVVLLVMATNARDDQAGPATPGIYFRGWDHLATMLGYPEYDRRAERMVARYVAELRTRGLVEPVAWRGTGRGNRVYRLHLMPRPDSKP